MRKKRPGATGIPSASNHNEPETVRECFNPLFAIATNIADDSDASDKPDSRILFPRISRASLFEFVASLALVAALSGCITTPPPSESFPVAAEPKVVLQPGDVLQVKFLYWPELNEEKQSIRPDGKISLQLVGDVQAQGRTPDELRSELLGLYQDKLIEPEISVVVNSLDSHRVYVTGEVQNPGLVMINGRLTALESIMQAGGFLKESAKKRTVVVVRQRDGQQFATTLDLRKALEESESEPFLLEPYDVVYVPPTNIDQVDQFVEQYVNRIVPRSVHWGFQYDLNEPSYSNNNFGSQLLSTATQMNQNAVQRMGAIQSTR